MSMKSLFEMDGWRKLVVVVLVLLLGFALVIANKMTGDAWGMLAGGVATAFVTAEVAGYSVKTRAAGTPNG